MLLLLLAGIAAAVEVPESPESRFARDASTPEPPMTTEQPFSIQMCEGETPVTCLFHAWQHKEGSRGYCGATPQDCDVLICPVQRPYLCHSYGRCVVCR